MNYERAAKIVFVLWGVYHIRYILINLKALILGIEVPEYISKYIDTSLYTVNMSATYSALIRPVIISIAALILIFFAWKKREWAYYGFIALLFYNLVDTLSFLPSMFAPPNTYVLPPHIEMYFFWGVLVWSVLLISGSIISIYILYINKRPILPLNYKEAVKSIYYLWGVFAIVTLINNLTEILCWQSPFEGTRFLGADFYYNILSVIFCVGIPVLVIFAYKRKQWAYHGFMVWLTYGFIVKLFEGIYYCNSSGDTTTFLFFFIPSFCLLLAFSISLYILYKNQSVNDLFNVRNEQRT